ncbi:MAG: hypothetical protein AB1750_10660, partial [Chloroflexota bacterium]
MKKLPLILLTIFALTLTACSASAPTEVAATSQTDPSSQALDGISLLAIGTLQLKDTPQAVTPTQAADLLPLWQVYQSLSDSDNAAQEEIDALVKQIEDTMTADQMSAINALGLTPQDMFAAMQELGIEMGAGRPSGSGNSNDGGGFGPGAGGPPPDFGGGGPPGGGQPGGGTGGTGLSPDQIATAQASRGANGGGAGFGNRVPAPL